MRILRPAILAVILAVALLSCAAPASSHGATAQGLPSVSLSPDFAAPGETISLTVTCRQPTATRSVITSSAFDPVTLVLPDHATEPVLTSTITINHVQPGRYTVTSTCDDSATSSTTLTVLRPGAPHLVPEGGARTGGGGMAGGGPLPMTAAGVVMLTAGVGLVAVTLRRRGARR
jgi:hypothetical protein